MKFRISDQSASYCFESNNHPLNGKGERSPCPQKSAIDRVRETTAQFRCCQCWERFFKIFYSVWYTVTYMKIAFCLNSNQNFRPGDAQSITCWRWLIIFTETFRRCLTKKCVLSSWTCGRHSTRLGTTVFSVNWNSMAPPELFSSWFKTV